MARSSLLLSVVPPIARRIRLWPAAFRQARALVPRGWWRRRPFLPVPDRQWMAFRMTTAYGSADAPIDADDLVTWLAWTDSVRPPAEHHDLGHPKLARPGPPSRASLV